MWQEVPAGKKLTETTPEVLRGAGRTVSVTETKAIFVCIERAISDIHDKKCKTALWFEPQTVWQLSRHTRLDQSLCDTRGLLREKQTWFVASWSTQAPGRPQELAPCRGRLGLLPSQLTAGSMLVLYLGMNYSSKGNAEYHHPKTENKTNGNIIHHVSGCAAPNHPSSPPLGEREI